MIVIQHGKDFCKLWIVLIYYLAQPISLSFPQNKQLMFMKCFGRGGQALLAWFSWKVFIEYLTTEMETTPVTFGTYRIILWQDPSIWAITRIIRDFSFRLGMHSRLAMTFMVWTMIFISVFPTLGSAMTGYGANVQAFVNSTDGNLVPFYAFQRVYYIIHDGKRLNKTDDFRVTYGGYPGIGICLRHHLLQGAFLTYSTR
jgi:hypothetical protein